MKGLMIVFGLILVWSNSICQTVNSRTPGDMSVEVPEVKGSQGKDPAKYDTWAARRAFDKRQKRGRSVLKEFRRDLEDERIAYHKRMIYQVKQARKLERRYGKGRNANPNFCYPPGKLGLKRKRFR